MITEYDQIEYLSRPFRQTHPDRIATLAMAFGHTPPDPATARVLDVGCGSGGNIMPMAAYFPGASFLGFDLASTAIAIAKKRQLQLGLGNIRFETLDLLDFPEDAGQFDYIIAHGFYSWVPDAVRERFWKLLDRHLSPNGIAYVSFNAYPGAMLRHAWRDAAAYHTRGIEALQPRMEKSLEMLRLMAGASAKQDAWPKIVQEMVAAVDTKGAGWVSHDDFGPFFNPFYFHQVSDAAGEHGLRYLSDAVYYDMQPHEITPQAQPILNQLAAQSAELREQYYDFLELRAFRQILLCRKDIVPQRPVAAERLRSMSFSSPADTTGATSNGEFSVTNPLTGIAATVPGAYQRVLDQLRRVWPNSLHFDHISPAEANRAAVATILEKLWGGALLEAHAAPLVCGTGKEEFPKAWNIARLDAADGQPVTTRLHSQMQLDETSNQLVARLDGTVARSQLVGEVPELDQRMAWIASMGLLDHS